MSEEEPTTQDVQEARADYVRSSFARVIHVDGAFGGLTNTLQIHLAVYSEHRSGATHVLLSQEPNGAVKETSLDSQDAPMFIREIEADLLIQPGVARAIRDWLTARLEETDTALQQMRAKQINNQQAAE